MAEERPAPVGEKMKAMDFVVEPSREQLVELARLVDGGTVRPAIDSVFPRAEARGAFERLMTSGKCGRVVLRVADD